MNLRRKRSMFPPERAKTNGKSHSGHKSQCCISMLGRCVQSGVSWQSAYCCRNSQHINLSSHNVQQSLNDDEDRRKAREREREYDRRYPLSLSFLKMNRAETGQKWMQS